MSDNDEIWRPVERTGGFHEVSNFGRIRRASDGRIRNPVRTMYGYLAIHKRVLGRRRTVFVHVAVLEAFVSRKPQGMVCRHLDGNKLNNTVSNLAWGTHAENSMDRARHGTDNKGDRNPKAKLTEEQVLKIRMDRSVSAIDLAHRFGVSPYTIMEIRRGRTWSHVSTIQGTRP